MTHSEALTFPVCSAVNTLRSVGPGSIIDQEIRRTSNLMSTHTRGRRSKCCVVFFLLHFDDSDRVRSFSELQNVSVLALLSYVIQLSDESFFPPFSVCLLRSLLC